jgi:hypothetical protein
MDTIVNELLYNDQLDILVKELGLANVRLIKLVILVNDQSGIFVIPVPIVRYFGFNPFTQLIVVIEFGIVKFVKGQPSNAADPILVTESGIVTLVRLTQLKNALGPILVTELANVTLTNKELLKNALSLILVTELGITYDVL